MAYSRADEFNLEPYLQSRIAKAIAHPARIVILKYLLKNGNTPFFKLRGLMPLARTTISHHVQVLVQVKLIIPFQQGEHTFYELDKEKCHLGFIPLVTLLEALIYKPGHYPAVR